MITDKEFAGIVSETKNYVLSAIAKNLPERFSHTIDDIVQETYFRAFRSLAKGAFRKEAKLSTWIYVIARNETLRMVKRLVREEEKAARKMDTGLEHFNSDGEPDETIIESIRLLPQMHRDVLECFVGGMKEKEIAERLNIPKGTVKSRLNRAKEQLRKLLREVGYERD